MGCTYGNTYLQEEEINDESEVVKRNQKRREKKNGEREKSQNTKMIEKHWPGANVFQKCLKQSSFLREYYSIIVNNKRSTCSIG